MAMRVEPLDAGERHRGGAERGKAALRQPQDRSALHEVEHAEP
jgi:hypothetical protein